MKLTIEKMDHRGRGIAHHDGKIVFIENALPDEEVEVEIFAENAKYAEGIVTQYDKTSASRVKSKCPYFEECGGCQLRHISYDDTIQFKKNKLEEILQKYAGIETEINVVKNKTKDFYRNKVELHIANSIAGFYKKRSHDVVEVDHCLNVEEPINVVMRSLDFFHLNDATMTIKCNYNGEIILNIESQDEQKIEIEVLRNKFKLVGIIYNGELIFGADHFIEMIDGMLFKETYDSFFQINRNMNKELFKILKANIDEDSTVLDMCCGVGTLSLIASQKAKQVYGIEIVENAVKDAIVNAKMNKTQNVSFLLGDAFQNAKKIAEKIDIITIDPPRSGLSKEGLESVLDLAPRKIIYISCDPITLSRDLKELKDLYKIDKVYLLDMFSYTHHVECVCVLNRR